MSPTEGGQGGSSGKRGFDLLDGSPYRALSLLGEGAMGEVFEAEHRTLGHPVVVKVLREPYTDRSDMRDRMRVEGQALARIRHPNLVMVTDFGQTGAGRPYLVMERLVGRSLREELFERPILPVDEAAEIARQMLMGLSAAHEAGLVHRDIKPDNVFLCADGGGAVSAGGAARGSAVAGGAGASRSGVGGSAGAGGALLVKVLDFGVVKIAQAGRDPRTPMPLLFPTAEGVTVGTPRYFSPEQARGERDLDARSDLYSVGLVLYRMVAGRGPFDEIDELGKLLQAHATVVPPAPSKVSAQPVPEELDRIVMKALLKNRDERHQDALVLADDLGRFVAGLGERRGVATVTLPPVSRASRERAFAEATTSPAVPVLAVGAGQGGPSAAMEPAIGGASVAGIAGGRAGAVVIAGGGSAASTPRKMPDHAVMLEGVVERVLATAPEAAREKLSRSGKIERTVIDAVPAASAAQGVTASRAGAALSGGAASGGSASVGGAALRGGAPVGGAASGGSASVGGAASRGGASPGRGSVPETVPMFQIAVPPRPPASGPGGPAPGRSSVPDTAPDFEIAVGPRPGVAAAPIAAPSGAPGAQPAHTLPLPTWRRPPARAAWKVPALIVIAALVLAGLVVLLVRSME